MTDMTTTDITTIKNISDYIETFAPINTKEEWDNCGILIGNENSKIKKAILALDITKEVIDEAISKNCDLIISHHPIIFEGIKNIEFDSNIAKLIENKIAALCMHTNLDKAESGVNDSLALALELKNTKRSPEEFLVTGELAESMASIDFAKYTASKLNAENLRYTISKGPVKSVAVSSGGGADAVFLNTKYGFDALVTSDVKHHQFLYAKEHNLCLIDAGHFNTENVVIPVLKNKLCDNFSNIEFICSETSCCPYKYI